MTLAENANMLFSATATNPTKVIHQARKNSLGRAIGLNIADLG